MNPPKIKRRRMADLEPWIEKLIQNYGQSQPETIVKANVVGVSSFFFMCDHKCRSLDVVSVLKCGCVFNC